MRKNKIAVCLMTALLLSVLALTELALLQQENYPFTVEVYSEGGAERITCWRKHGCYYVFLPSGADPAQTKLVTNPLFPVWIEGQRIDENTVCGEFPFEEPLGLTSKKWGRTYEEQVFFCQSANIPTLYIDTASGSMDYIHKEKGNAESGKLRLYSPQGALESNAQIRSINGRGNSTWEADNKKPYSFELWDRTDLLGMGAAKKWILLANYYDSSNMGNKMCFDFAADVGCAYTPESQWVDLYLNGNYAGLYLLTERNEVDPQRVDISEDNSFLVSTELAERWDGRSFSAVTSRRDMFLRIHHGQNLQEWILDTWQSVEDAVFASDGVDPATGKSWEELIDVDSWARQYLLWEVFAEYDAGTLSKFFYCDERADLVYAGPVWDMDNILNCYGLFRPNILSSQRRFIWNRDEESLFYRLYQKDSFRERVIQLYWEEYRPRLLELAETGMNRYLEQIQAAAVLNDIYLGGYDTPMVTAGRQKALQERIAFLDGYFGLESDYCVIEVSAEIQWRSYAVRRGEPADFLPSENITWIDYETGEPFDLTAPITRDRVVVKADDADCPADESPME